VLAGARGANDQAATHQIEQAEGSSCMQNRHGDVIRDCDPKRRARAATPSVSRRDSPSPGGALLQRTWGKGIRRTRGNQHHHAEPRHQVDAAAAVRNGQQGPSKHPERDPQASAKCAPPAKAVDG